MQLWWQFITKHCYRLQKEYENVVCSPCSVSDPFKHCCKRDWIHWGGGSCLHAWIAWVGQGASTSASMGRPRHDSCSYVVIFVPHKAAAACAQAANRRCYGCWVLAQARARPPPPKDPHGHWWAAPVIWPSGWWLSGTTGKMSAGPCLQEGTSKWETRFQLWHLCWLQQQSHRAELSY